MSFKKILIIIFVLTFTIPTFAEDGVSSNTIYHSSVSNLEQKEMAREIQASENPDDYSFELGEDGTIFYKDNSTGLKQVGWHFINGAYYFFDLTTGAMATGLTVINGETYCFDVSGRMFSDVVIGDAYFAENGKMTFQTDIDPEAMAILSANCRYIVFDKSDHYVEVWYMGQKVAQFAATSAMNEGAKVRMGDQKTPEGEYYICQKNPVSQYYKALLISYPNSQDAYNGLQSGLIKESEFNQIQRAIRNGGIPPQTTALGGYVEFHGNIEGTDNSLGCIRLSKNNISMLYEMCQVGDKVLIKP